MTTIGLEYKGGGKLLYSWKEGRITPDKSKGVVSLPEWWHSFQINSVETQGKRSPFKKKQQQQQRRTGWNLIFMKLNTGSRVAYEEARMMLKPIMVIYSPSSFSVLGIGSV